MKHILLNEGRHLGKLPHLHKQKLKSEGKLPKYIYITREEIDKTLNDYHILKVAEKEEAKKKAKASAKNKEISKKFHEEKKRKAAAEALIDEPEPESDSESITVGSIVRSLMMKPPPTATSAN
mmetsp:Transcript_300/g.445  ORF Transcript_300/g.445 Transcript_300/m.445 type:complete len:123 (+) Transcript_300:403-771(+)